jgi:hypothetical protein
MAAHAAALTCAGIWERFRGLAERYIEEGNVVAGERLWEVVPSPQPATVLTIRSTRRAGDSVECAFDASTGAIVCAPGPAVPAATVTFHAHPDLPGKVRRGELICTVDEAINLILDELVWDEGSEGAVS